MARNTSFINHHISLAKFFWGAKTKYQVHSPFVSEFIKHILEDDRHYYFFDTIENYRRNLGRDRKDFNSHAVNLIEKYIKKNSISSEVGKILFKTIHFFKPAHIIEIGTSLGIATLYQATPNSKIPMVTLEENAQISNITQTCFKKLGTKNIGMMQGNLEQNLSTLLSKTDNLEFVFFNQLPFQSFFNTCVQKVGENSIFVFRAIHSSSEIEKSWEEIKRHPAVKLSLDLFDLGILFFKSEQKEVQHFQLIESWKKPWAVF